MSQTAKTYRIKVQARMRNGDVHTSPWAEYSAMELDRILEMCKRPKDLNNFRLGVRGGTNVWLHPEDISCIKVRVKRSFWELPLFKHFRPGE